MPKSSGIALKNFCKASSPPADAPMPQTGTAEVVGICESLSTMAFTYVCLAKVYPDAETPEFTAPHRFAATPAGSFGFAQGFGPFSPDLGPRFGLRFSRLGFVARVDAAD